MTIQHTPPSTYILRDLIDMTVPESVSWWPQTIGWKILGAVLAIFIAHLCYRAMIKWWCNRYRSEAMQVVTELNIDSDEMPNELFSILKIVLTHVDFQNANLFGEGFLNQLDQLDRANPPRFSNETGLVWMTYLVDRSSNLSHEDRVRLKQSAMQWLKQHKRLRPENETLVLNSVNGEQT